MPYIQLQAANGRCFQISTRNQETLEAWLDEILPITRIEGRPGIDDFDVIWPRINVHPFWAEGPDPDPDWLTDGCAICGMYEFPARDGREGIDQLGKLRERLAAELAAGRIPQ